MTRWVLSARGASDWGCVTKEWCLAGGCHHRGVSVWGVSDQRGITRGASAGGVTRGCTMHSECTVNAVNAPYSVNSEYYVNSVNTVNAVKMTKK